MTYSQALREARRRWGTKAMVEQLNKSRINKETNGVVRGTHLVGCEMNGFFEVKGDGSSWEHAFAMSKQVNPFKQTQ